ncbi:RNA polymerase sigma factor [Chitinophaga sp. Cy-1792]|uniref:RNA polymerase sigma factor n=1 Tax=Chitinophaga sp. Cy-1792 TaxID=2608339 RepID=UPI001423D210|nr:sigma-70 family RNA polymerase sigma factor [Chitinophaga sp. Cy-1792]NIG55866.1 sigma-70 family RNA polymerase sigma factor [Chitinophaga sp. Cy-1792]
MPTILTYQDNDLLQRIASGDEQAFAVFFRETAPLIRAHIFTILKEEEDTLEVLQETFMRVWLQRERLPAIEFLLAYIKQIAARRCFTLLQKRLLREKHLPPAPEQLNNENEAEEMLAFKESQQILNSAINELPDQRRQIYLLNRYEGLTSLEIATRLQLSHSYVRNALSTANKQIREKLRNAGKYLPSFFL